jgi:hypothetical protein
VMATRKANGKICFTICRVVPVLFMAFRVSLVKRFPLKLLRKQSSLRFVAIRTGKKRLLLT